VRLRDRRVSSLGCIRAADLSSVFSLQSSPVKPEMAMGMVWYGMVWYGKVRDEVQNSLPCAVLYVRRMESVVVLP
jgi:hypothetical protein